MSCCSPSPFQKRAVPVQLVQFCIPHFSICKCKHSLDGHWLFFFHLGPSNTTRLCIQKTCQDKFFKRLTSFNMRAAFLECCRFLRETRAQRSNTSIWHAYIEYVFLLHCANFFILPFCVYIIT